MVLVLVSNTVLFHTIPRSQPTMNLQILMLITTIMGIAVILHNWWNQPLSRPPPSPYLDHLLQVYASSALAMQANATIASERRVRFDTDSGDIGVDNRCTACISHELTDFEPGSLKSTDRVVKGFAGSVTANIKTGTLLWSWENDDGVVTTFRIPNSYYVASGKVRLLSPQHWAQTQGKSKSERTMYREHTDGNQCVLTWDQGNSRRTIPLSRGTNVAAFTLAPGYSDFQAFCIEVDILASSNDPIHAFPSGMVSDDEDNESVLPALSRPATGTQGGLPQTEQTIYKQQNAFHDNAFNRVDFTFNGTSMSTSEGENTLSTTSTTNVIIDEEDRQPSDMAEMLMIHHQYGHISMKKIQEMAKQGIIPKKFSKCRIPTCSSCMYAKATKRPWRGKQSKQGKNEVIPQRPGQIVSVDQLVSPTPGLIAQMTGHLTNKRYRYATVYVDQLSRFGYIHLQKTASAEETIEGKRAFEAIARREGVRIENYHADNGVFRANEWDAECKRLGQGMSYAGVNAHHQNGMAERRVRELQDLARTMLIHANARWRDNVTAHLWPYAIRTANEAFNHTPSFQDQDRRTPIELFTGSNVASNPKHWKPFGCPVYVLASALQGGSRIFHKWAQRSTPGIYLGRSPLHGRNVALVLNRDTGLVSPQFHVAFDPSFDTVKSITSKSRWQEQAGFVTPVITKGKREKKISWENLKKVSKRKRRKRIEASAEQTTREIMTSLPAAANVGDGGQPTPPNESETQRGAQPETTTRSGRKAKAAPRLIESMVTEISQVTSEDVEGEIFCYATVFADDDRYNHDDPLLVYKATSDPDTLYYHQAMKENDCDEFLKSMVKEIDDQSTHGNFTVVHRSEVPEGVSVLPAVWQFKRKRDVKTGKIKKYKGRLNIDGSRMRKGEHYDKTYSPVASWNSVRMLLTLTAVHGWKTKQIDYVQAFAQAPVEKTLYMKIPAGIELEDGADPRDYVLMIHRNIYGQKQAGRVWNQYLVEKLLNELGFKQSKVDECVFYRGKTIYVLYTDDSILAGPDEKEINKIIKEMQSKAKLDITIEGDLADFLGVNIDRKEDGSIHLTQPNLIQQILKDLRLDGEEIKPKSTPAASSKLLSRHSTSKPFDRSFDFRSVIGKLNYLEKATRGDIAYAVHQCARFVADPKVEHGEAVRWLGRYLAGTKDKGTILRPDKSKELEIFVDASFCGDWCPDEAAKDRDTARSRHGYIINYAACPILWKSQLQTEIALSSTESEYTGLSYALRDGIPIMELLKEMKGHGFPINSPQARTHCRVFEDNSGALEMAKIHKYRPRTKHLNVRLHHFRDYVDREEISIHAINTLHQTADILTKPVNEETLLRHRLILLGW